MRLVHVPRQRRIHLRQQGPIFSEIQKVAERHLGATTVWIIKKLLRADADPRQLAGYTVTLGLVPYTTDTDHGIKLPRAHLSHAVPVAKHTRFGIGIIAVRPLVDQSSHDLASISSEWRPALHEAIFSRPFRRRCLIRILAPAKRHEVQRRRPNELDCYDRSVRPL